MCTVNSWLLTACPSSPSCCQRSTNMPRCLPISPHAETSAAWEAPSPVKVASRRRPRNTSSWVICTRSLRAFCAACVAFRSKRYSSTHPRRDEAENLLQQGLSVRHSATAIGVGAAALHRHWRRHAANRHSTSGVVSRAPKRSAPSSARWLLLARMATWSSLARSFREASLP
jgi:hypothetical protein